ncbi:MAG TPA: radical SAM protein [Pyrinomonadaceae bacterium]|nr:radical SAM protein [Pyrinomonadaceae bacterium]
MNDIVRIWYVSAQRLCNFRCSYCVSINDYAKSNTTDWLEPEDQEQFKKIVNWIAERPFRVGVRLATLGEPFTSPLFLSQAAWLTTRPNVAFVELLTNGSLLKQRLDRLDRDGDISKVSLWITHHHTEISVLRFIENARYAQEKYGCFVVVNGLLFPDNAETIMELKQAAEEQGLRFNLDLGYDPFTPHGANTELGAMVPILKREDDGIDRAVRLGANPEVLSLTLRAMKDLRNQSCCAGHSYFYIGIRGDVYRCSRYQVLHKNRIGNVLDDGFEFNPNGQRSSPCEAGFGCVNKEDFLNLRQEQFEAGTATPSLGWVQNG